MNAEKIVASIEALSKGAGKADSDIRAKAKLVGQWLLTKLVDAGVRENVPLVDFTARFSQDESGEWAPFSYQLNDESRDTIFEVAYKPQQCRLTPIGGLPTLQSCLMFARKLEEILHFLHLFLEARNRVLATALEKLQIKE